MLIHDHYLSQKDIEICLGFNIQALRDHSNFAAMEELHEGLRQAHAEPEEAVA